MKKDIHPKYVESQVTCACGNTFGTRSTLPKIKIDICSECHPFFTGNQKLIDTAGRVERFQKRFVKTGGKTIKRAAKKLTKKVPASTKKKRILSTVPKRLKKAVKKDKQ
ncbi:MAG: 50S ribosomal protein L31 [bacterium]